MNITPAQIEVSNFGRSGTTEDLKATYSNRLSIVQSGKIATGTGKHFTAYEIGWFRENTDRIQFEHLIVEADSAGTFVGNSAQIATRLDGKIGFISRYSQSDFPVVREIFGSAGNGAVFVLANITMPSTDRGLFNTYIFKYRLDSNQVSSEIAWVGNGRIGDGIEELVVASPGEFVARMTKSGLAVLNDKRKKRKLLGIALAKKWGAARSTSQNWKINVCIGDGRFVRGYRGQPDKALLKGPRIQVCDGDFKVASIGVLGDLAVIECDTPNPDPVKREYVGDSILKIVNLRSNSVILEIPGHRLLACSPVENRFVILDREKNQWQLATPIGR